MFNNINNGANGIVIDGRPSVLSKKHFITGSNFLLDYKFTEKNCYEKIPLEQYEVIPETKQRREYTSLDGTLLAVYTYYNKEFYYCNLFKIIKKSPNEVEFEYFTKITEYNFLSVSAFYDGWNFFTKNGRVFAIDSRMIGDPNEQRGFWYIREVLKNGELVTLPPEQNLPESLYEFVAIPDFAPYGDFCMVTNDGLLYGGGGTSFVNIQYYSSKDKKRYTVFDTNSSDKTWDRMYQLNIYKNSVIMELKEVDYDSQERQRICRFDFNESKKAFEYKYDVIYPKEKYTNMWITKGLGEKPRIFANNTDGFFEINFDDFSQTKLDIVNPNYKNFDKKDIIQTKNNALFGVECSTNVSKIFATDNKNIILVDRKGYNHV